MSIRTFASALALCCAVAAGPAPAGEVPLSELRALERAIESGLNNSDIGSQTLGDLQRLKDRLEENARSGAAPRGSEPGPYQEVSSADSDSAGDADVSRLEREAADGKRTALRTLALYRLFQNDPEAALKLWNRMGEANANDLAYRLMASYIELALGEYGKARTHLEMADRLIGSRTGLGLSKPIFCDNIAGYRLYAPRQSKDLLPGDNTLVYVEIEGADFHDVGRGESECRLMFGIRLKNDSGVTVWSDSNYGEYAPIFNGPIRDLHTALTWRIPNDLAPGVYTMTVEAVEESSKRRGDAEMEFTVGRRSTNQETKLDEGMRREANRVLQEAGKQFPGSESQYFKIDDKEFDSFRRTPQYMELLKQKERFNRGTD